MDSSDDYFSSERRTPTPAARPLLQQAVSVDQGKMHAGSDVNGQSRPGRVGDLTGRQWHDDCLCMEHLMVAHRESILSRNG